MRQVSIPSEKAGISLSTFLRSVPRFVFAVILALGFVTARAEATVITFDDNPYQSPNAGLSYSESYLIDDGFYFNGAYLTSGAAGYVQGDGNYVASGQTHYPTGNTYLYARASVPFTLNSISAAQLFTPTSPTADPTQVNATEIAVKGVPNNPNAPYQFATFAVTQAFQTYDFPGWTDLSAVGFYGIIATSNDPNLSPYIAVDNIDVSVSPEPGALALAGLGALLLFGRARVYRHR